MKVQLLLVEEGGPARRGGGRRGDTIAAMALGDHTDTTGFVHCGPGGKDGAIETIEQDFAQQLLPSISHR